jgi:hypothetical protein
MRREVYEGRKELLGEDDAETLLSGNMLVRTHLALRQADEALKILTEVKPRREKFAAAKPADRDNTLQLAITYGQIGEAQQLAGEYAAAHDSYAESLKRFEAGQTKFVALGGYFGQMRQFYQFRQSISAKIDDAVQDLAFAEKQPPGEVPLLLEARLHHMRRTGQLDEAAATAERIEDQIKRGPTTAYQAGLAWSLVSDMAKDEGQRDQYAARAMTLLGRVKSGPKAYFVSAEGQAYALHFNPDLAPLRDRAEFKAILQRLPKMGQDLIWKDQAR